MLDLKKIRKKILESEEGKRLLKEFGNTKENVEFYGRERTKKEIEESVFEEFFSLPLEIIAKILPEVWEDIKERVKDALKYDVLFSPKTFEECIGSSFGKSHIDVPFDLDEYFEDLITDLIFS